jgi:mono/diheme cytochrome c family protein
MPARIALAVALPMVLSACGPRPSPEERAQAVAAFTTVQQVFQHPRCQNCHIPGDAPLQFDAGLPHAMEVTRGPEGHGPPGLPCATCHGETNPPASYGAHAPPGAPHWGLPPPDHKMAWIGLSPGSLCEMIKDKKANGGRDFEALIKHVSEDKLVLWGWSPGHGRAPVSIAHDQFVASFKQWAAAGGPCPANPVTSAAAK